MCVRGPALYKHGDIFRCFKIFFQLSHEFETGIALWSGSFFKLISARNRYQDSSG
jgi:hypothetical protein